jgi:hypothetical protein
VISLGAASVSRFRSQAVGYQTHMITVLIVALAVLVLALFFFGIPRRRFRRRWGSRSRFGRGPVTGRWGRRI